MSQNIAVKDIDGEAEVYRSALHSVGFEPTSTNTFELESNPLDRSGTNAMKNQAHLCLHKF